MYARIRKQFSPAAMALSVIALVFALAGGAYAAKSTLTPKQKKEVEKIAKKYAGAPGAPGAAGTNGTNGTNGKDGAAGEKGAKGDPGAPGTNGADGASVEVAEEGPAVCAGKGGVVYEVAGTGEENKVCNGEPGPEGALGTAGTTLPPGATETGSWAYSASAADTKGVRVPLSFPIPLGGKLEADHVHYNPSEGDPNCEGSVALPQAASGHLCVYVNAGDFPEEVTFTGICLVAAAICESGANRAGAILAFSAPSGPSSGSGTFAVTAPLPAGP